MKKKGDLGGWENDSVTSRNLESFGIWPGGWGLHMVVWRYGRVFGRIEALEELCYE